VSETGSTGESFERGNSLEGRRYRSATNYIGRWVALGVHKTCIQRIEPPVDGPSRTMRRRTVVLHLAEPASTGVGSSTSQVDAMRRSVRHVKDELVSDLRRLDPTLRVTGIETIFSVLEITTNDYTISRARAHPLVTDVTDTVTFRLAR
jgi:hypothetical protein